MITIATWNVNGLRAALRHGFGGWLKKSDCDIVCLQETKALPGDVPELADGEFEGYRFFWMPAKKKGYSGVALAVRKTMPSAVEPMGIAQFDDEGRVQAAEFGSFTLINAYFPNSQPERARIGYKLDFCRAMLDFCDRLTARGRNIVLCGDYNIAHREIDLANPRQNGDNPGFLPEERAWMDEFTAAGYVDVFRHFDPRPGQYTWWSYRAGARERNIGWRIDYHCVNAKLLPKVKACRIYPEVQGSDHCPVTVSLSL